MKKILLGILVFSIYLIPMDGSNQPSIDQLKHMVAAKQGKEKVTILKQLTIALLSEGKIQEAEVYIQDAEMISVSEPSQSILADLQAMKGYAYQSKYDYTNAGKCFLEELRFRNQMKDDLGVAEAKNRLGFIWYLEKNHDLAVQNLS
ncbi:MAG: hypothetical protein HKN16_02810, partial [Saprospiraceae bacterium]|nr:hypothetical protein [Saprospiraceae bacterium]